MLKVQQQLLILLLVCTSCNEAGNFMSGNIIVKVNEHKKPSIANVKVQNDQLIVTGTNLDLVTLAKVADHEFQIESKTSEKLILNAKSTLNFLVGSALNLVVSNANAAATFPLSFELQNGQVTASKLHHMGASTGEFLQFNGSTWVPASISTNQVYVGTYNASTDSPNISAAVAAAGTYYIVTTAGAQDLGSGLTNFDVGDWVISDGTNWSKVSVGTNTVSNFNGRTGAVVPLSGDYSWSMLTKAAGKLTGSKLQEIADVDITGIQDQDILQWNASTSKWEVTSVPAPSIGAGTISNTQIANGAIDSTKIVDGSIVNADISATAAIDQSKISNLTTDLGNKEPKITAGTAAQYWSGSKTWQDLNSAVIDSTLTGYSASAGAITSADSVLTAINKLSGNIGLSTASQANYVLKAGDTMSGALAMGGNKITGLATPTAGTDAATMAYVDSKVGAAPGDNLGNHSATQNLALGTNKIFAGDGAWNSPSISFTNNTNTGFSHNGGIIRITANGGLAVSLSDSLMQLNGSFAPYLRLGGGTFGASGPTYAFNGDPDTGMFNISSNILAFTTGGAEKMRILATGEMLIGKTASAEGKLDVAGDIASEGKLRLKSDNTNYVEFRAPASLAATTTYTFPATAGSAGQVLTTDGAGNLSWSAAAGGTPADGSISYAKLNLADGDIPLTKLAGPSDATKYLKGDKSWGTFITDVLASTFATVTPSNTAIANGDSLQTVVNKTQGQINNLASNSLNKTGTDSITGTLTINAVTGALKIPATPSGADLTDAANVQYVQNYVDTFGKWIKNGSNVYYDSGAVSVGTNSMAGPNGIESKMKILRPLNKWGLTIEGEGTNQADIMLMAPGGTANNRIGQIVNTIEKMMFRSINDDATIKSTNLSMLHSNGYVGVGTATPLRPLHVSQPAAAGGNAAPLMIQRLNTSGTPSANELTVMQFQIPNSAGTGILAADMGSTLTDVTPGSEKGALIFRTTPDGGSTIPERMRIDSAGNIGVGTSTPLARLHIKDSLNALSIAQIENTSNGTAASATLNTVSDGAGIGMEAFSTTFPGAWGSVPKADSVTLRAHGGSPPSNMLVGTSTAAPLHFMTASNPRMTIGAGGSVGIGTTNPAYPLHLDQPTAANDVSAYVMGATMGADATLGPLSLAIWGRPSATAANRYVSIVAADSITARPLILNMASNGVQGRVGIGTTNPVSILDVAGQGWIRESGGGGLAASAGRGLKLEYTTSTDSGLIQAYDYTTASPKVLSLQTTGGDVGIGTTAPGYRLHVNGSVAGIGAYNALSDRRYKKDFEKIPDALERVIQLNGFFYKWRQDEHPDMQFEKGRDMGVIAQDVHKVFPEAVSTDKKSGIMSVAYSKLIAPIIEAIKELFTQSQKHEREIASLKEENRLLKESLCELNPKAKICTRLKSSL
ncbi:tail fiber domain-containing protein [Peredibacter sp. HCB2-198]|uniref:tail fiber domain-containing protein n=1 Tax=Peredibacter sp. HCB2-198 TaxID=3383025 RepID=UPI0038B4C72E